MQKMIEMDIARICVGLTHKRRVKLLKLLVSNPACGRSLLALEMASNIPHSSLIHHLKVLQDSGMVQRKSNGVNSEYVLNTIPLTGPVMSFITALLAGQQQSHLTAVAVS